MWGQFNNVNVAFANRIATITDARNKLQMHLRKVICDSYNEIILIFRNEVILLALI